MIEHRRHCLALKISLVTSGMWSHNSLIFPTWGSNLETAMQVGNARDRPSAGAEGGG